MRLSLFREGHRSSWKLLVIFAAVLSLYISMITTMFDPEMGNILQQLSDSMPQLMAMVGMQNPGTTLVSFLSTYLYGMLLLAFPWCTRPSPPTGWWPARWSGAPWPTCWPPPPPAPRWP